MDSTCNQVVQQLDIPRHDDGWHERLAIEMGEHARGDAREPDRTAEQRAEPRKRSESPAFAKLIDSQQLLAMDMRPQYIVRGILVKGQPCVIGGRSKTLKTSIATDLVVSLGSGTPFLGHFPAEPQRVGFWSGESGAATVRETALRVADAKGVELADCPIFWSFALPKLSSLDHRDILAEMITKYELDVVLVDPLYLSLLNAQTAGQAGNLFAMGAALQPLSEIGQQTGCTIVVLHHFRKSGQPDHEEPAGLEELSQSGIAEWARQWLLLQRRSPYRSDGRHELWLRAGGSAGHGGLHAIDIEEGILDLETFTGRTWDVTVQSASDAREVAREEARKVKELEKIEKAEHKAADDCRRMLEATRRCPAGETQNELSKLAGISGGRAADAIRTLLGEGRIERCQVTKNKRAETAYRPAR